MATFLGVHTMDSGMPADKMKTIWESYKAACAKAGLTAKHTHANSEKGRAFCVTEANGVDEVQKAHDDAGIPVNEIIEVTDLT